MAQDFERHIARATGTSGATIYTAGGDDAVVSIRGSIIYYRRNKWHKILRDI